MADDSIPKPQDQNEYHLYRQVNLVTAAIRKLGEAVAAVHQEAPLVSERHHLVTQAELVAAQFSALETPIKRLVEEYHRRGR